MPVISQIITIEQAIAREQPTWDVMIGGFGRGNDGVYPAMTPVTLQSLLSVHAVAIGPRSELDRVYVLWDPQVVVNPQIDTPQIDYLRRMTRQAPLLFPQIGRQTTNSPLIGENTSLRFIADPLAASGNDVGVDDSGTLEVPDNFFAVGSTVPQAFTLLAAQGNTGQPEANHPILHLVFYLKPPLFSPPHERFPYEYNVQLPLIAPSGSPLAENPSFAGAFPVHGRRQVNMTFYAPPASSVVYDVRIGAVQPGIGVHPALNFREPNEVTVATATGASAVSPQRIQINNPGVDWLTVWATMTSGAFDTGLASIFTLD